MCGLVSGLPQILSMPRSFPLLTSPYGPKRVVLGRCSRGFRSPAGVTPEGKIIGKRQNATKPPPKPRIWARTPEFCIIFRRDSENHGPEADSGPEKLENNEIARNHAPSHGSGRESKNSAPFFVEVPNIVVPRPISDMCPAENSKNIKMLNFRNSS